MTDLIGALIILLLLRENYLLTREVKHWREAYGRK